MNNRNRIFTILIASALSGAFLIQPTNAHAWYWSHDHHYKKHKKHKKYKREVYRHSHRHYPYSHGKFVFSLPYGVVKVVIGGSKYYYHHGTYYHKGHHGYHVVKPPLGACVDYLPYGYEVVYVDGHKYYVYNGTYYKRTYDGYVVVDRPQPVRVKKVLKTKKRVSLDHNEEIIINIPNNNGGYTPVTIQRTKDGYIGPQGEYYEDFPRVDHLKIVYGSK